jgi:hypothetical protein
MKTESPFKKLEYDKQWIDHQKTATKALLKFCEDHSICGIYLEALRQCLAALQAKDIESAVHHYRSIPFGNMGCFDDWNPQPVFEHETGEYTCELFQALTERWQRLMKLSLPTETS